MTYAEKIIDICILLVWMGVAIIIISYLIEYLCPKKITGKDIKDDTITDPNVQFHSFKMPTDWLFAQFLDAIAKDTKDNPEKLYEMKAVWDKEWEELLKGVSILGDKKLNCCPSCKSNKIKLHSKLDYVFCESCGFKGTHFDGHPFDAINSWNSIIIQKYKKNICKCHKCKDFNEIYYEGSRKMIHCKLYGTMLYNNKIYCTK